MLFSLLFVYSCVCCYIMSSYYNLYCRTEVVKVQHCLECGMLKVGSGYTITIKLIYIHSLVVYSSVRAKTGSSAAIYLDV
jgi:hypothetical protein